MYTVTIRRRYFKSISHPTERRILIALFIDSLRSEPVNLKTLKIPGIRVEDILAVLSQVYLK